MKIIFVWRRSGMIGKTVSHYKILAKLGEGGMGVVYKAEDIKLKRLVALKFLPSHLTANEEDKARFLQEARAAAALNHNNVCTIHEICDEDENLFIVMEYVEGKTLRDIVGAVREPPLQMRDVISYAAQIAEALKAAHQKGVIHRDIKSDNIMVTEQGQVKVMDFGLAKLRGSVKLTKSSSTVGTMAYMAPEYLQGGEVDARADIFSFGVVLYEMLTGILPFKGEYDSAMMYSIVNEEPEPIQKVRGDLSSEIIHILNRALEKDPEDRYQTVNDMLIDLHRVERNLFGSGVKPAAPVQTPVPRNRPFRRILTWKVGIPVSIVLLGIILILVVFNPWRKPGLSAIEPVSERSLAVMYFENNTGDESLDHWRKALSDLLITDLVQSRYIEVLSGDRLFQILQQLNILESASYSSDDLKDVGIQGRVKYILRGNFAKAGNTYRINTVLQVAGTSEHIGTESVEGAGEESIFSMVDELTTKIKASLKFTAAEMSTDFDRRVEEITTSSPEAYKYYSEGRRYHDAGDFRRSIAFMEKAVAIDPQFATAYRSMGVAYGNMFYTAQKKRYIKKAFDLSDRVSEREKYRIQADYYVLSESTYDRAIATFKKLIELYPDDMGGWTNLGNLYLDIEEWDKASECFQWQIERQDKRFYPYFCQAFVDMAQGRYQKAEALLQHYLENYSEHPVILYGLGNCYLIQGRYEASIAAAQRGHSILSSHNFAIVEGSAHLSKGDIEKAEALLKSLMNSNEEIDRIFGALFLGALHLTTGQLDHSVAWFHEGLKICERIGEDEMQSAIRCAIANAYLIQNMPSRAIEECDRALALAVSRGSFFGEVVALALKGFIQLRTGSLDEARKTASEMKDACDKSLNRKLIRYYHLLTGMIGLEDQNYLTAVRELEKAVSLLHFQYFEMEEHALFIHSLAQAYYRSGDPDRALEELEKISLLTTGRTFYGDIYARSFYMKGRIYEEKGMPIQAATSYERFLEIWKDADAGLPEPADARARLQRLTATD
jgi:serine/threonine protein kinase/tetratricopeptide (TPR) repeat protein